MATGRLEGKVALVTGGSSGIGLATARRVVAEGAAHVFLTGRRTAQLDAARAELDGEVTTVPGDLADLDDLDELVATIRSATGALDVVVSAAGFVDAVDLEDVTPEHFDRTFAVNARGTFFLLQRLVPLLRPGGSIVLVASAVHRMGVPHYAAYSASKAAMRSFARSWAAELKDRGIRVNVVSPGSIDTPAIDAQASDDAAAGAARDAMAQGSPMGRIGLPEEVAAAAVFLASSDAGYTTGADLPVDGGLTTL